MFGFLLACCSVIWLRSSFSIGLFVRRASSYNLQVCAILWDLWGERNSRVFRGLKRDPSNVWFLVFLFLWFRRFFVILLLFLDFQAPFSTKSLMVHLLASKDFTKPSTFQECSFHFQTTVSLLDSKELSFNIFHYGPLGYLPLQD